MDGYHAIMIGYNLRTKEIIYSTPWGKGHEFKRCSFQDAYEGSNMLVGVGPK